MIDNKKKYQTYIKAEGQSLRFNWFFNRLIYSYITLQPIKRFLLLLRTSEYFMNCKKGIFNRLIHLLIKYHKYKLGLKLGFTIPENVAKKGLQLPHYGAIAINANTKIGENCRIHICTNIGAANKSSIAPIIGNNVYIGPGVMIYGAITIANNIKIAPNSAVSKDFLEENIIIGGVPAKHIIKKNKSNIR
jgi:serine O-acetyltransferase